MGILDKFDAYLITLRIIILQSNMFELLIWDKEFVVQIYKLLQNCFLESDILPKIMFAQNEIIFCDEAP